MIDVEKYPDNYNWIPKHKQELICRYLTLLYNEYNEVLADGDKEQAQIVKYEYRVIIAFLNNIGIFPEIGWYGHRHEYFLVTRNDAESYNEWLEDLRHDG